MLKNKFKSKNIIIVLLALVAIYVGLQIYLVQNSKIEVVKAVSGFINDSVITTGIVCREETILTQDYSGVLSYQLEDGDRVSKGNAVANVYSNYQDIDTLKEIEKYQALLNGVISVESYMLGTNMDVTSTKNSLLDNIIELSNANSRKDYKNIKDNLLQSTTDINKLDLATGKITNTTQNKEYYTQIINNLKATVSAPHTVLYAPVSGYFLRNSDGYENIATVDNFLNFTYDEGLTYLQSSIQHVPSNDEYGKLIGDYKWTLCIYVDNEIAERFTTGKTVEVSLNAGSEEFQKGTITNIVNKGEKTLITVQCTLMDTAASTSRIVNAEIRFKQYNGIKIPKNSIRIVDGQMGVYVKYLKLVQFKPITPMYEDGNYIIVSTQTSDTNKLKLYDEIIIKGRNLYDGKYL